MRLTAWRAARRALSLLVETLRRNPSISLACLSPSIDNVAAQKACAKAGFRKVREYDAPGFERRSWPCRFRCR